MVKVCQIYKYKTNLNARRKAESEGENRELSEYSSLSIVDYFFFPRALINKLN